MTTPTYDFTGRTLVLTGAAGGIATETARIFASSGANLVLADLDRARVDAVAADLTGAGRIVTTAYDAADHASADALVELAVREFGGIDVLVPAAGIYPEQAVRDMSDDDWRRVQAINLDGVFALVRRAIPHLRPGSSIVTIASIAGHRGSRFHAHYAASKAGVIAFTRSLALELGPDVRVNGVSPGPIVTPMTEDFMAASGDSLLDSTPLGRLGQPGEVAGVVAFLASDGASFVNGEFVHVNGGIFMAG